MVNLSLTEDEFNALGCLLGNLEFLVSNPHSKLWSEEKKLRLLLLQAPSNDKDVESVYQKILDVSDDRMMNAIAQEVNQIRQDGLPEHKIEEAKQILESL